MPLWLSERCPYSKREAGSGGNLAPQAVADETVPATPVPTVIAIEGVFDQVIVRHCTIDPRGELAATTKAALKRLPSDPDKLWGLADRARPGKVAHDPRRVRAEHTVDAVVKKHGSHEAPASMHHAVELAAELRLDMGEYWQPSVKGYFGRVSKRQTFDAVAEAAGPSAKGSLSALKKADLAKAAEKIRGCARAAVRSAAPKTRARLAIRTGRSTSAPQTGHWSSPQDPLRCC
jgi:hypothetical protein